MGRQWWRSGTSTSDIPAMPAASTIERAIHPHCSAEKQAPPYRLQPVGLADLPTYRIRQTKASLSIVACATVRDSPTC